MLSNDTTNFPWVADSADVHDSASLGSRARVWHGAQIREGATLGTDCTVGRNAYIGVGVSIGDRCKIQNNALVYEPAVLADGVFIGPGAVLTNDRHPRAVRPDGQPKSSDDWEAVGVTLHEGASIGAAAVCVAPVRVGRFALVAAGAVVTRDVADFALVAGNPAAQIGWVGRAGHRLRLSHDGLWQCPLTGARHQLSTAGVMVEVER